MNESQKKEIAAFRYQVISDLVQSVRLSRKEYVELIREKSKRQWQIPYSDKNTISESTIRRWIKKYNEQNQNIMALFPQNRNDSGGIRVLEDEIATMLLQLHESQPDRAITEVIAQMKQMAVIPEKSFPSLSTIYRFLKHHRKALLTTGKTDRRRFEAEFPNDLWQSDVMYGPKLRIEGRLKRVYLIAFLDDHSRIIPHASFYLQENLSCFLNALKNALQKRGIPRKLYVDNGPAFRSKQLAFITASLAISLVHAKPYSPQGKGKIERFFRTVRKGFLSGLQTKAIENQSEPLMELNEAFDKWLYERYLQVVHSSTSQTPLQRFTDNIEMVRAAPNDIENHFRWVTMRTVTKDRVVHLEGKMYETPVDLVGERIELLYHPDHPGHIEARFEGKNYGELSPINLGVNVRAKRGRSDTRPENTTHENKSNTGSLFGKSRREQ